MTVGERIVAMTLTAIVLLTFIVVNPQMVRTYNVRVGPQAEECQEADFTPGGSDGVGGCFPGPDNTGVPAGTSLTTYSGPNPITVNNTTINAKTITAGLSIDASNVTITNSHIIGSVNIDEGDTGASLTITDSWIETVPDSADESLGTINYTATRVKVTGGRRSVYCWTNCIVQDSYVADQADDPTGVFHESGLRMTQNGTFLHNTIWCNAADFPPDAGCSADQTGYGDFATTQNNLFQGNLFPATTGGYCSYGGSSLGKPFPNANNIRYIDNIYGRVLDGAPRLNDHGDPDCGFFGAVTAYNPAASGNQFTNNRYDSTTGPLVTPGGP